MEGKIDASPIESALSTLQMVIARPAALFDPYAAIVALDEVANVMKEKKYKRVGKAVRWQTTRAFNSI